jgi:hypothetical protein
VPDRIGYIYRQLGTTAAQLHALIEGALWGWAWTPAQMYLHGQGRRDDLLQADEGRVCHADREIRWRRAGDSYDVLVLALAEQHLDGFTPLHGGDNTWHVQTHPYLLQPPFDIAAYQRATAFVAPDGSTQFVALIGDTDGRSSQ